MDKDEGSGSPGWTEVARAFAAAASAATTRSPRPSIIFSSKDDSSNNQLQKLQRQVTRALKGFSSPPRANKGAYNPEILTTQKRQWARCQLECLDHRLVKEPSRILESMIVVGLHPNSDIQALQKKLLDKNPDCMRRSRTALTYQEQVQAGVNLEPQVLFAYPPDKELPLKYRDLLSFCFPGGLEVHAIERTPSMSELNEILLGQEHLKQSNLSFVFRLQVADNSTLYGCCVLVEEIVQKPSRLISILSEVKPSFSIPSRLIITAPRCYCILSRLPFFDLHFGILKSIFIEERLQRLTEGMDILNFLTQEGYPTEDTTCTTSGIIKDKTAEDAEEGHHLKFPETISEPEAAIGDNKGTENCTNEEEYGTKSVNGGFNMTNKILEKTFPEAVLPLLRYHHYESSESSTSLQGSPSGDLNFRSPSIEGELEEPSSSGHEESNDHSDVLAWAKENNYGCLQIICEYFKLRCPSRGSTLTFHPLEHLHPIEYHRPGETLLHIAGSTMDLRSCNTSLELTEAHNSLSVEEEATALSVWTIACLCGSLRLENILTLFAGALLEKQIVVICSNLGILSAVVLSVIPLIRPYQWQCLLMPVLPSDMLEFLDAPVPYVVGVKCKTSEVQSKLSNTILIDADKNQVKSHSLPKLPQQRELLSTLSPYHATLVGESYLARKRPVYECTDTQVEAAKGFLAVLRSYLDSVCSNLRSHTITNVQSNDDKVFKCGPLLISSKGIGWTSWKKRWFILTRASLVFFRSDPNAPTQRGSEVNLTLGGIELNNSGSVVVRADKKLLTVLFPDGRDGRAFTLKAETSEDMHEWRIALECALSLAPSAALVMGGQSSIFQNDVTETVDCPLEECQDRGLEISTVIENPISLDLEDDEGNPSFLEKAIRFIEQYGVNVEGILRQSADVEEVERRVEEYKQGKNEFSSNEDAHVIGDCIKHVLRELPSSPVPASCCAALLEAFRGDCGSRVNNIRSVIFETFPEPNRYLLQRILKMMQIVASHKSENRMSLSAVAACMAPLLLRPLLAGDCELEDDFHMGGDGSVQLLQAAAAANHAQAIVIILLEHYERIFSGETLQYSSSELYSETEGSEEEEYDYDDEDSTENEIVQENGYHDADDDFNAESEADNECTSSGEHDESSSDFGGDLSDNKATDCQYSDNSSSKTNENPEANTKVDLVGKQDLTLLDDVCEKQSKESPQAPQNSTENSKSILDQNSSTFSACINDAPESSGYIPTSESPTIDAVSHALSKTIDKTKEPGSGKRTAVWGRTSARKNLSMENIDYHSDDENAVQRLEAIKSDLESKLTEEVKENELLQSSLELRKQALHNHRIALQQDVERLILQLENERALRASLEAGLLNMQPGLPISAAVDSKTKKNLEEIAVAEEDISHLKQEVIDLQGKINQQKLQISDFTCESCGQSLSKSLQSNTKNGHGDVSLKIAPRRSEKSRSSEDISSALVSSNENTQMLDASALQNMQKSASLGSTKSTETYSSIHEQSLTEVNVVSRDCSKAEKASSASLRQKQPPRKQRHSLIRSTKSLSPANSTSREAPTHTSRRTSPKGEDTVSGSASALTRLTNRLNFLKERRVQLVNEIQVVDTSHAKGSKCPPPRTNSR